MGIDFYLETEKKYGLYEKEIEGIHYWMFARFDLWNYNICAQKDNLVVGAPARRRSISEIAKEGLTILRNSVFKGYIPKRNYDILFFNHSRKVLKNDEYWCIYTDELSDTFESSFTVEEPYNRGHLKPSYNKKTTYTDYILTIGKMLGIAHGVIKTKRFRNICAEIKNDIYEPIQQICDYYKVSLDADKLSKLYAEYVISYAYEKKLYRRLIKRVSPKLVIEVVHYTPQSLLVNEVCHELNIKVIELQHGTMHSEHAGYKYNNDKKLRELPDIIYTYSDYWHDIMKINTEYIKVISTGYPYFEEMVKKARERVEVPEKKVILFLSQGTIGKQLFMLATELQKIIDTDKYQIIFKLHPAEYSTWRERYSTTEEPKFRVVDDKNTLLYDLFAMSSIEVGVYSTSMYEGLGFNLETYIYNIAHADTMSKLVDSGFARYVNNAEELYSMITDDTKADVDIERFWKSNALNNMICEIQKELD